MVSYELPTDADAHLHRIGRTGRAGQKGHALHLVAAREINRASMIQAQQGNPLRWGKLVFASGAPSPAQWITLAIDGGRQDKLRPGDILGALTGEAGLPGDAVGKIDIFATRAYVAVRREQADNAMNRLRAKGVKGRNFRVRRP